MAETSLPYPMIDKPLPLAGGGAVQLYTLIVFATPDGSWRAADDADSEAGGA